MDTVLSWIGLAVGAAGTALGFYGGRQVRREDGAKVPVLIPAAASLIGILVIFFLTRPVVPPFSPGQQLGYGALIGGLVGVVAGWILSTFGRPEGWGQWLAAITAPSAALFGVSLTLLIFASYPTAALGGFLLGAVIAAVIFRLSAPTFLSMDVWATTAVTLAAATMLAMYRYDTVDGRIWWRAPILILAAAIIAHLVSSVLARPGRTLFIPVLVSAAVTIGLAAIFSWKVFPSWHFLLVAAAGVITFLLALWINDSNAGAGPTPAVTVLLVVALTVIGFREMAGFGIGIALLAGSCVLLPAFASLREEGERAEAPSGANVLMYLIFIGLGVLLIRLFMEGNTELVRGLDMRPHYTMMAVAMGAVLPFILPSFFPLADWRSYYWRTAGAVAAGIAAAAAPLVLLVVWGPKALLGFLIGIVASKIFLLFVHTGAVAVRNQEKLDLAVLATTSQVSAVMLSALVAPLSEETRKVRIIILGAVFVVGILWGLVSYYLARRPVREG